MFVFIGTKIAIPGTPKLPDEAFYYWVDGNDDYLADSDGDFFIHGIKIEKEVNE